MTNEIKTVEQIEREYWVDTNEMAEKICAIAQMDECKEIVEGFIYDRLRTPAQNEFNDDAFRIFYEVFAKVMSLTA